MTFNSTTTRWGWPAKVLHTSRDLCSLASPGGPAFRFDCAKESIRGDWSKLGAQPSSDHRDRAAITVVRRISNELIVEREPPREERQAVVHFDDPFGPWIWQPTITHEDAETPGIEKRLMHTWDSVDDTG